MPITKFQQYVLKLIKKHRNPNSYVAGGVAMNRDADSVRHSNDIDFFQDTDTAVTASATADIEVLKAVGCQVKVLLNQPSFWRVVVSQGVEALKLEWVRDTAFRFYPVIEDPLLGFRLHDVDLVVNKCLALANRNEVRDIIDLIYYQEQAVPIATACWAACGKDPGFTPVLLLDSMRRNSIIRPEQLAAETLTRKITAPELKQKWLHILSYTEQALNKLTASDLGCLYLDTKGAVVDVGQVKDFNTLVKHYGSIGGSWPQVVEYE